MHSKCKVICIEGCVCPPGQTLNEHRQCIPVSSCSCIHSGHYYPPEFLQRRGKEMCECSQGHWDCHEATAADIILTPPPNIARECDPSAHEVATDCVSSCPLTCNNYHHHEPCTIAICYPGCRCQKGYILDTSTGTCVEPHNCPCHHGGKSYEEGEQVTMDCNTWTATAGSDVVQSGRPIFDDFFQHLWPYFGNNTANVVFQMVKRLWLNCIDQ
ncbi:hemocytin [Trichonephila clavipes]|nr:hemocytin [Trichonephila clavipes]